MRVAIRLKTYLVTLPHHGLVNHQSKIWHTPPPIFPLQAQDPVLLAPDHRQPVSAPPHSGIPQIPDRHRRTLQKTDSPLPPHPDSTLFPHPYIPSESDHTERHTAYTGRTRDTPPHTHQTWDFLPRHTLHSTLFPHPYTQAPQDPYTQAPQAQARNTYEPDLTRHTCGSNDNPQYTPETPPIQASPSSRNIRFLPASNSRQMTTEDRKSSPSFHCHRNLP